MWCLFLGDNDDPGYLEKPKGLKTLIGLASAGESPQPVQLHNSLVQVKKRNKLSAGTFRSPKKGAL